MDVGSKPTWDPKAGSPASPDGQSRLTAFSVVRDTKIDQAPKDREWMDGPFILSTCYSREPILDVGGDCRVRNCPRLLPTVLSVCTKVPILKFLVPVLGWT